MWASQPKDEWIHTFFHTLDEMLQYWYVSAELRKEITTWEELTIFYNHTFSFTDSNLDVHNVLQLIRDVVLKVVSIAYPVDPHANFHMQSMMECYNVSGEPDDDDMWNINIPETKGSRDVKAPDMPTDPMNQPLKIRRVNIGIEDNPNFTDVKDYWDE